MSGLDKVFADLIFFHEGLANGPAQDWHEIEGHSALDRIDMLHAHHNVLLEE